MVRLQALSGTKKAFCFEGATFPVRVGRGSGNDLVLEDPGVWSNHFCIEREGNELILCVGPDAILSVNGEGTQRGPLRNGDIISIGATKLRFGFTPVRQSSHAWRERLTWVALAGMALGEIAVAYAFW